jgi:hypothetical protein
MRFGMGRNGEHTRTLDEGRNRLSCRRKDIKMGRNRLGYGKECDWGGRNTIGIGGTRLG